VIKLRSAADVAWFVIASLVGYAELAQRALAQQVNDPNFAVGIVHPAFTTRHPRIGIDGAHRNFHTMDGRYKPFADLMASDGYAVSAAPAFQAGSLKTIDILVIANAMGESRDGVIGSAFMPEECDAVRDWVRGGGSLMLIADHAPWGDASVDLARRFNVEMGRGFVMDLKHADGNPTRLVFSLENGLLGEHAIVRGRSHAERVHKVIAFTGQSLSVPANATVLLRISNDATESFDPEDQRKIEAGLPAGSKLEGRAQGIAMRFGRGRVAVFGEAAMFSAQVATMNGQSFKVGMNVPGTDDRQFALNVVRWLAGLLK
jgi:hypothetical protein